MFDADDDLLDKLRLTCVKFFRQHKMLSSCGMKTSINDGVAFGVDVRARGCVAGRIAIEEEGEDERNEMGWEGWYTCRNHAEGAAACNCVV